MGQPLDITGQKFNLLTVLERTGGRSKKGELVNE